MFRLRDKVYIDGYDTPVILQCINFQLLFARIDNKVLYFNTKGYRVVSTYFGYVVDSDRRVLTLVNEPTPKVMIDIYAIKCFDRTSKQVSWYSLSERGGFKTVKGFNLTHLPSIQAFKDKGVFMHTDKKWLAESIQSPYARAVYVGQDCIDNWCNSEVSDA